MIIYIDKSIAEHGKHAELTIEEETMFTELACAHRRGYCYLCGDVDSIDWLKQCLDIYRKGIYRKHAEMGTLLNAVQTLIVISYDEHPTLPTIIKDKARVISIEQAINFRLNEQCVLLGEFLYDCDFYKLVAARYMHAKRDTMKGISLSLRDVSGGGVTSNKVLEKSVSEEYHLTLCLADSDTKHGVTERYPNDPAKGDTANNLLNSKDALHAMGLGNLFEMYCLTVHEVENLIPISVLDNIANKEVIEMRPGVAYLKKLQEANQEEAILFYDFKNGNNIESLRKASEKDSRKKPSKVYWEKIANQIGDESAPCLNKYVLSRAIRYMSELEPSGQKKVVNIQVDTYLEPIWEAIGLKMFSWGCAQRPSPA